MGTVILFQFNQIFDFKFTFKRRHVAHIGTAECIDTLIIIPHRKYGTRAALTRTCHEFEPFVLQIVGILKLIHKHMAETLLIMFTQRLVTAQQFIRPQ